MSETIPVPLPSSYVPPLSDWHDPTMDYWERERVLDSIAERLAILKADYYKAIGRNEHENTTSK